MPSNLAIDDRLLNKALKIGGRKTKKETVNEALSEYVLKRERKKVLEAFGSVDYYEDYNPKKYRK
jgi:Arc/MetJ family transcription regulator